MDDSEQQAAFHAATGKGDIVAMRVLLDQSADAAGMMLYEDEYGYAAFLLAAEHDEVDAIRLLLEHPSADTAEMLVLTNASGDTAFMLFAGHGNVNAVRLLLDHPSADPAAMLLDAAHEDGRTALLLAVQMGHVDVMHLLLNHPSADPAAMMMSDDVAAAFAAVDDPECSCAPLLLLLRRVSVEPSHAAQKKHMSKVMKALCRGPRSKQMFDNDQPDDNRDECVRLLIARGARILLSPVVSRIIREQFCTDDAQMARVPQFINEAVVGILSATSWGQGQRPRDNT
ncbi:hypothetical protein FOA52_014587 [Chlamydomonas sp. UWO 241]|nr:hypothetical protein FOA52_014587 [Chlamydomonas sp. UWO 241]